MRNAKIKISQDLDRMIKEMTDPEEIAKARRRHQLENRKKEKVSDTGL